MTNSTLSIEGFLQTTTKAHNVRKGDTIVHLDGRPAMLDYAGIHKDDYGYAYDFRFGQYDPKNSETFVPYAMRGNDPVTKLVPIPKVGDLATMCLPSDSYPYVVVKVSPSGKQIEVRGIDAKIVRGSFQTGDAVVEYSVNPNVATRKAHWSEKHGCFKQGGTPLAIGHARYYQAPEV